MLLPAGAAAGSTFDNAKALAFSQSVIGQPVGRYRFTDMHGDEVILGSVPDKPLVVSFIFTSCYHVCPLITANLQKVVGIAGDALGSKTFDVVTIGFDTAVDTPERMRVYAGERGINSENWNFLSGDRETVDRLSRDLGFIYYPSPRGFDHLSQTTVIDSDGIVYRQVYGDSFEPPQLVEPLKELVFGTKNRLPVTISDWINNVRLFCTVYDPASGRYIFDYSVLVTFITGFFSLGIILFFIIHLWRTG